MLAIGTPSGRQHPFCTLDPKVPLPIVPTRRSMPAAFPDDLDLSRRAIAGQPGARDQLAHRLRCIGRILGARNARGGRRLPNEALEDLVQDVATTVWRKLPEFAADAPLEGWVAAFCQNAWRNAARGESRRAARSRELVEEPAACDAGNDELDGPVHRCLDRLVAEDAAIVRCKHFEGLTLDEIARRVDRNLNAIKARYYRALLQLRQCLGGAAVPA